MRYIPFPSGRVCVCRWPHVHRQASTVCAYLTIAQTARLNRANSQRMSQKGRVMRNHTALNGAVMTTRTETISAAVQQVLFCLCL